MDLSPFQAESLTQMGEEEERRLGCLPGTFALPLSPQGVSSYENSFKTKKINKIASKKNAKHTLWVIARLGEMEFAAVKSERLSKYYDPPSLPPPATCLQLYNFLPSLANYDT